MLHLGPVKLMLQWRNVGIQTTSVQTCSFIHVRPILCSYINFVFASVTQYLMQERDYFDPFLSGTIVSNVKRTQLNITFPFFSSENQKNVTFVHIESSKRWVSVHFWLNSRPVWSKCEPNTDHGRATKRERADNTKIIRLDIFWRAKEEMD